jgi:hypothetical protein
MFEEGKSATVHVGGQQISLTEGTVNDLVATPSRGKSEDQVHLGHEVVARVVRLGHDSVRVYLTIQHTEIETAGKDGVLVAAKTLRVVQKVRLGNPTTVVLEKDARGSARSRVEFTVTEAHR